jgi:hypothetical protein
LLWTWKNLHAVIIPEYGQHGSLLHSEHHFFTAAKIATATSDNAAPHPNAAKAPYI